MNTSGKVSPTEQFWQSVQGLAGWNGDMRNDKLNRRAQYTREQLQQALTELMAEKSYDSISVQEIAARANVGRTTFYAHFRSKDELFLHAHAEAGHQLGLDLLTIDQLLAPDPPEYLVKLFESFAQERSMYFEITRSDDALIIWGAMRQRGAAFIERCLRDAYRDESSQVPLTVLANYLGGAQFALVWWWLADRPALSARELAAFYQRFQRVTIQDALNLPDPRA
jgi:AcrR family transcriptional regulator